LIKLIW